MELFLTQYAKAATSVNCLSKNKIPSEQMLLKSFIFLTSESLRFKLNYCNLSKIDDRKFQYSIISVLYF